MELQGVKLIIGLGNPGKEYEKTYHNVGFLAVDYLKCNPKLSTRHNLSLKFDRNKKSKNNQNYSQTQQQALASEQMHPNLQILKSDAFMNQSGSFVTKALKKFGIKPTELLIIHDDSDIELGKYKISFGRGSAGHKGVESIIKSLGTKNFWRLRIGIRKKSQILNFPKTSANWQSYETGKSQILQKKAGEFVLKKITKKDLEILNKVFEEAKTSLSS